MKNVSRCLQQCTGLLCGTVRFLELVKGDVVERKAVACNGGEGQVVVGSKETNKRLDRFGKKSYNETGAGNSVA